MGRPHPMGAWLNLPGYLPPPVSRTSPGPRHPWSSTSTSRPAEASTCQTLAEEPKEEACDLVALEGTRTLGLLIRNYRQTPSNQLFQQVYSPCTSARVYLDVPRLLYSAAVPALVDWPRSAEVLALSDPARSDYRIRLRGSLPRLHCSAPATC